MRLLAASAYRRMPWKNGGGETAEIAVGPVGASLDGFGWRVSMAWVAQDGPFSSFPGVDRTLAVLEGEGIELAVQGAGAFRLTAASPPHRFAADVAAQARLLGGPVVDLNTMTRRERFSHQVERLAVSEPRDLELSGETTLLFAAGACTVTCCGETLSLARFDALADLPKRAALRLAPDEPADFFLIRIETCEPRA